MWIRTKIKTEDKILNSEKILGFYSSCFMYSNTEPTTAYLSIYADFGNGEHEKVAELKTNRDCYEDVTRSMMDCIFTCLVNGTEGFDMRDCLKKVKNDYKDVTPIYFE